MLFKFHPPRRSLPKDMTGKQQSTQQAAPVFEVEKKKKKKTVSTRKRKRKCEGGEMTSATADGIPAAKRRASLEPYTKRDKRGRLVYTKSTGLTKREFFLLVCHEVLPESDTAEDEEKEEERGFRGVDTQDFTDNSYSSDAEYLLFCDENLDPGTSYVPTGDAERVNTKNFRQPLTLNMLINQAEDDSAGGTCCKPVTTWSTDDVVSPLPPVFGDGQANNDFQFFDSVIPVMRELGLPVNSLQKIDNGGCEEMILFTELPSVAHAITGEA